MSGEIAMTDDHKIWLQIEPNHNVLFKEDINTPSGITITNGGGFYTTDWINPTSGLADYWNDDTYAVPSIVTGNGFSGNAQRIERYSTASGVIQLYTDSYLSLSSGNAYKLVFKYRCSYAVRVDFYYYTTLVEQIGGNLSINTGDAVEIELTEGSLDSDANSVRFTVNNDTLIGPTTWLEIDEIYLYDTT